MVTLNRIILLLAVLTTVAATLVCVPLMLEATQRISRRVRIRFQLAPLGNTRGKQPGLKGLIDRGLQWFLHSNLGIHLPIKDHIERIPILGLLSRRLASELEHAGYAYGVKRAFELSIFMFIASWLVSFVFLQSWIISSMIATAMPAVVFGYAHVSIGRRIHALREQLPDALRSISLSLGAGQSLLQAIDYSSRNVPLPLSGELAQVVWDIEAGKSITESLDEFKARASIPELGFVALAFNVQHRTGGSLQSILNATSSAIKDSIELERSLQVQTAQARLSARVVALMPVVMFLALMVISPEYIEVFFTSTLGVTLFILAIILDLAGLFAIKRILSVDTGGMR